MTYKVVKDFKDLKDNGHVYRAGDSFPRFGVKVGEDRIAELSTKNNMRKTVLIEPDGVPAVEVSGKKMRTKKNAGTDTEGDKKLLHS